jgi:hypothetical protein
MTWLRRQSNTVGVGRATLVSEVARNANRLASGRTLKPEQRRTWKARHGEVPRIRILVIHHDPGSRQALDQIFSASRVQCGRRSVLPGNNNGRVSYNDTCPCPSRHWLAGEPAEVLCRQLTRESKEVPIFVSSSTSEGGRQGFLAGPWS